MILDFIHVHMCFLNLCKYVVFDICVIHPHGTRVAYPQLPSLAQGALDSTNACYEACGEVELLATIANRANHLIMSILLAWLLLGKLPIIHMSWPSLSSPMLVGHHLAA